MRRSVGANRLDWQSAPRFDYFERDRTGSGTTTYHVLMILGSPYLVAVHGSGPAEQGREARLVARETARRKAESAEQRAARVRDYENARERDEVMLEQISEAFDFALRGQAQKNGRAVYVIDATPRRGYSPPDAHARALTGMRGTLWIDTASFNWVEVSASVVRPVSIYGFFATVEPGTAFEMEKAPVGGGVWMPTHFSQHSRARVLFVFPRHGDEDLRYWGYTRAAAPVAR